MRRLSTILATCLFFSSVIAQAEPLIIDVTRHEKKKVSKPAAPKIPEVRLALSDSDTARGLAPGLVQQLQDYGYEVSPQILFSSDEEAKPAKAEIRIELLRSGQSCLVSAKATESGSEQSFWRWETSDDLQPCAAQLKTSLESFAKARPPANPKALPESEPAVITVAPPAAAPADAAAAGAPPAAAPVAGAPAAGGAPAAAAPVDGAPAAAAPAAPPAAAPAAAPARPDGTSPIVPMAPPGASPLEQGEPGAPALSSFDQEEKKCGCSAASAAPSALGLLCALGLLRRRRSIASSTSTRPD